MVGIYAIKNTKNGKIYVGQSTNIDVRIGNHKSSLIRNRHDNPHLQSSWNKYGETFFIFCILEVCEHDLLNEREQYWLEMFGGVDSKKTYNQMTAGDVIKMSERAIEKMRKPHSVEHHLKIAASNKGKKRSQEVRHKMKMAQNDPIVSNNRNRAVRESFNNPLIRNKCGYKNKGRKLTESHKQKLVESGKASVKNNREVYQILDNKIITTWFSIREAQDKLRIHNIGKVCKNKRGLAGGYEWRYVDEYTRI